MRRSILATILLLAVSSAPAQADVPVTLRGSLPAMERQHGRALDLGFPFVRTPADMARLEAEGELVRLEGNDDYGFRDGVVSLVARPEMRAFVERLSAAYRTACDEKLIVTSLTRPTTRQPSNAHRLSVHPAGIAVDLRVSRRAECRDWLEDALLTMEEAALLDVTKERSPPHYHVALFPDAYMSFLAPILAAERQGEERAVREREARAAARPLYGMVAAPPRDGRRLPLLFLVSVVSLGGLGLHAVRSPVRKALEASTTPPAPDRQ